MIFSPDTMFFVLDVESMGLYGDAISYAYLLGDIKGNILKEHYKVLSPHKSISLSNVSLYDIEWVVENVIPLMGITENNVLYSMTLEDDFYYEYIILKNKHKDLIMVADCPFPVESNFLNKVFSSKSHESKMKLSPCPIIDLATFRTAKGLPIYFDRLENELPAHNTVNDNRQCYRGLLEAINK